MKKIVLLILLTTFILGETKSKNPFSDWKFGEVTPSGYVGIPIIDFSKTTQVVYYYYGPAYGASGELIENTTWVDEDYRDGKYGGKLGDITNLKITLPVTRFLSFYWESSDIEPNAAFYHRTDQNIHGQLRIRDNYLESFENKTYGFTITADPSWFKK